MASGSGSAQLTMARTEGTPANHELGGAPRKKARTEVELELDVFYNPTLRAYAGWEIIPQPWTAETAMKYVNFAILIACGRNPLMLHIAMPKMRSTATLKIWRSNRDF